ncbi:MAG TPA: 3D domain-containing protein [Candidatus Agathobaculum merdipullorum]|nr:3D domain-containing protein [uncultured Agathobaculum sp.]HIY13029.1 3D domain-containing protein [Candidatus Agathobaculum merdipullorum]
MFFSMRKHASKLIAATLAIGTMASISAAALDQPVATLSSNLNASVGTVLTSDQISTAEQALSKAKAEAEAKAKAEAEAAKTEAAQQSAASTTTSTQQSSSSNLVTDPVSAKTVAYSSSLLATDAIKNSSTALGNYKLTFYCPCELCNGVAGAKTASGTTPTEGRTIAVDSSVIPLGSRVYIEGYGVFIAEDTGGAIKDNKIDVFVSSHDRAYELGVQYANIYLLG